MQLAGSVHVLVFRLEERRLRDGGYNSNDEKGTADVPMDEDMPATKKKSKSKKRQLSSAGDPGDMAGLADLDMPQDLEEDDGSPADKRLKGILESDDD